MSSSIPALTNCKTRLNHNLNAKVVSYMSLEEAKKLSVKDKIDHRDLVECYAKATIVDKKGSKLKIHYDVWSNYELELFRFTKYKSISERPKHRFFHLQKGDKIDINHTGWHIAEIKKFEFGQIQTVYIFWTHIDNENEVAQLNTFTNVESDRTKYATDERETVLFVYILFVYVYMYKCA